MHQILRSSLLGALLTVLLVASAQAASVTLRIEGGTQTRVGLATVPLPTAPVGKAGQGTCPGATALGALDTGVAGDWDGTYFDGFGYSLARIQDETYNFGDGAFWSVYVDDHYTNTGICTAVNDGDEVVLFAACDSIYGNPPPEFPCYGHQILAEDANSWTIPGVLALTAPAIVAPGTPFTVGVNEAHTTIDKTSGNGSTQLYPSEGASVGGATTDAGGGAAVTLTNRGVQMLRVTKPDFVPDQVAICVSDGADGFCGSSTPDQPAAPALPCVHDGDDGRCGTPDRKPTYGFIKSIREHQHFRKGHGPRELKGTSDPDPSGLKDVQLRLTRNDRGRCSRFSGTLLRFAHLTRCGARRGTWFSIGSKPDWSYLLPKALGRGRYVLDLRTVDGAGNADVKLDRTRNRVVFFVG
jgi:hypothetical protein